MPTLKERVDLDLTRLTDLYEIPLAEKEEAIEPCMVQLTPEEQVAVQKFTSIRNYEKGTMLVREGEICTDCHYIKSGLVRQFYLDDGEEKTTYFYREQETIVATMSSTMKIPSSFYLECLEDTTMKVISNEQENLMYEQFPRFENLCRVETEKILMNYQETFAKYIRSNAEERYLDLLENSPDLLLRVPQYQLASYIGVKPESLSRIRKRLAVRA